MGSNNTCRTLRHYNEQVVVKLKGVDSQLDTNQCLLFLLGKDKCHGHTGVGNGDSHAALLRISSGNRLEFNRSLLLRKKYYHLIERHV